MQEEVQEQAAAPSQVGLIADIAVTGTGYTTTIALEARIRKKAQNSNGGQKCCFMSSLFVFSLGALAALFAVGLAGVAIQKSILEDLEAMESIATQKTDPITVFRMRSN